MRKGIKTNHEVKNKIVKSTENVEAEDAIEDVIEDVETEEEMNNSDSIINDGNIYDTLTFYRD